MRNLRIPVTLALGLILVAVFSSSPVVCLAAPKKKGTSGTPMIVVGGAAWCGYCKQLKERLATDPSVLPFSSRFRISHVDLEDKTEAANFAKKFRLQQVALPTLVVAAPDGTPVEVALGSPQGKALPNLLQQALMKMGMEAGPLAGQGIAKKDAVDKEVKEKEPRLAKRIAKQKDPEVEARLIALREARKLLREKKIAEAVAVVASYADQPRSDALGSFISSLEKEGHGQVASAREQMEKQDRLVIGAVALVKSQRLYGKLPAIEKEIDSALELLAQAPQGKQIRQQAEAVDKGRALDEAGDSAAAIEIYQKVAATFANSQVASMAEKRIKILNSDKSSQ